MRSRRRTCSCRGRTAPVGLLSARRMITRIELSSPGHRRGVVLAIRRDLDIVEAIALDEGGHVHRSRRLGDTRAQHQSGQYQKSHSPLPHVIAAVTARCLPSSRCRRGRSPVHPATRQDEFRNPAAAASCPGRKMRAASRRSGSRTWRSAPRAAARSISPRCCAPAKIASAKPCQLVWPPATRCHKPDRTGGWRNACAVTSAMSAAGVGAPTWSSTTRSSSRSRRQAQHRAQEVVPVCGVHPGGAEDQVARAAGLDRLLRRRACSRRRRPAARSGSSSRYGRVPVPSNT